MDIKQGVLMSELGIALTFIGVYICAMWINITYFISAQYTVTHNDDIVGYYLHLCKKLNIIGKILVSTIFVPVLTFHYLHVFLIWFTKKTNIKKKNK